MKKLVPAVLALLVSSPLFASPILQDNWDNSHTVKFFNAFGQSFTAEDAAIQSIGFSVAVANPGQPFGGLTVKLFQGAGFGGALLASTVVNPVAGLTAWADADFSAVAFAVGQQYTFQVLADGNSPYWAVQDYTRGPLDTYAGGSLYLSGVAQAGDDMRFRVTPVTAPVGTVPEPTSLALFALGFLAICGYLAGRVARSRE
jgi:hypothetical protein